MNGLQVCARVAPLLVPLLYLPQAETFSPDLRETKHGETRLISENNLHENARSSKLFPITDTELFRRKRSQRATIAGLGVIYTLLRGLKIISKNSDKRRTVFEKHGDYQQSLMDFYTVKPKHVRTFKSHDGDVIKIGHVGDRRLVVRKHGLQRIYGKERPTLEIIHLNPTGEHFMNVIRYKEDL